MWEGIIHLLPPVPHGSYIPGKCPNKVIKPATLGTWEDAQPSPALARAIQLFLSNFLQIKFVSKNTYILNFSMYEF